jgi:hypothetical protein
VLKYQLLKSDQVELFTHMEMVTLCFCRSADHYLKDQGIMLLLCLEASSQAHSTTTTYG